MKRTLLLGLTLAAGFIASADASAYQKTTRDIMPNAPWADNTNVQIRTNSPRHAATRAEAETPSMVWGYCQEAAMAGALPAGMYGETIIGFTENYTRKFDGCKITSIIVQKGYFEEEVPVIDLFICEGESEYVSQDVYSWWQLNIGKNLMTMLNQPFPGEQWDWVEFPLDEPFEITAGNAFYIGWGYLNSNENNCPLTCDFVYNDNPDSSWMCGYDPTYPTEYDNQAWTNCQSAGSNCVRVRIAGDNLPADDLVITSAEYARFVEFGNTADIKVAFNNAATKDIESATVEYGFAGGEMKTIEIEGLNVAAGENGEFVIKNVTPEFAGNLQLDINVTKVNGRNDADYDNNKASLHVLSLPEGAGFDRNVVVEEGTGTWCGNCPRGIVGMEKMGEKYPETFIGIAVHDDSEMPCDAYYPYLERYIDGYPMCTVDRVISSDPNFKELEANFLSEAAVPAIADINVIEARFIGNMILVDADVTFAVDEENADYGWAYVVTENNVGPYMQTNYYDDGSLEDWDYTDYQVLMKYNEVARVAEYIFGNPESVPATIKAGEKYEMPMTIDCKAVKKIENSNVIVMMINRKTGYIENAVQMSYDTITAVEGVAADGSVKVAKGIVSAFGTAAELFTLEGAKVANLANGQSVAVANGLYIVRANGKAYKILVK